MGCNVLQLNITKPSTLNRGFLTQSLVSEITGKFLNVRADQKAIKTSLMIMRSFKSSVPSTGLMCCHEFLYPGALTLNFVKPSFAHTANPTPEELLLS